MENKEIIKEVIVESSKEVAKNVYEDAVKPAAENVGGILDAFTGFFNHFVLYPLKKLNIKYKEKAIAYERKMQEEYNNIPVENRVEPELHIVGPAMESLKYNIMQDDLAEMFSNLLVSDMDTRTQKWCSSSLIKIIEQMSPNDARVFKKIYNQCNSSPNHAISIGQFRISTSDNFYVNDRDNIPEYITDVQNDDIITISKSIVSLRRLGLIDIDFLRSFNNKDRYQLLLDQASIKSLAQTYSILRGKIYTPVFIQKGIVCLNSLSHDFAKVCLREQKRNATDERQQN